MKNIKYEIPEKTEEILGQRIRERRKLMKLTQKNLADRIGLTFQQVQKYEAGLTQISLKNLLNICNALDCNPDYFIQTLKLQDTNYITPSNDMETQLLSSFRSINSIELRTQILKLIQTISKHKKYK